jgi:hypothetical protein
LLAPSHQIRIRTIDRNAVKIAISANENIGMSVVSVGAAMHTQCRPECLQ